MDEKKALKNILDLCKQGNFKESSRILYNIEEVKNEWAIAIIIGCCTCVVNNSRSEDISEDDLFSLLKHVVSYVKDINEADLLSYVRSMFHILKSFINKKCYRLIAEMGVIFIPPFLPLSLPKKHSQDYQSSANLLHNLIIKTDHREFQSLVDICSIVSKIYARVSNISALLSTSLNCTVRLSNLSCPTKYLKEYYFKVISLMKLYDLRVDIDDDFKNFLSHFILIYHSLLKEFDFKEAAKFYEKTLGNGIEMFNRVDYVNVLKIMRFPLLLAPSIIEDKFESLIKCKRRLSNLDKAVQKLIGSKLNSLIYTIVTVYYKSINKSEWCKLSEVYRLELLQFIRELGRLELLPKFSCPCKCLIEKNVYQAFCYMQYIYTLLEISVRHSNTTSDFNKDSIKLLTQFCDDVKTLKEYNCEKWKAAWNTLGMAVYNIGTNIYQHSNRECLHYYYNLIENFIKIEFRSGTNILKFSVIGTAFIVIINYNVDDYKKCMALSALGIEMCPSQRNNIMLSWIKAKVAQRDAKTAEGDQVQKITLVSAFKRFKNEMEFLTDGANLLTAADKIDLLVFELEQYKKKWKSKVPMMSVLKELCDIADLDKTVEVIVNIFGDCELMLHEDVPKILQKILERYEEKTSGQENSSSHSTIFLAILYYMHYKYCVKDAIVKNADDMERSVSVALKTDEPPDPIPKDPSEECDIVSFYDSLNLNRYFHVMKHLNKSLELFATVITDNFDSSIFTKVAPTAAYNLLVKISMEYKLHRYRIKNLQALQLALKVAQFENNACNIVWAIGFIVENSDVKRTYVRYLTLIADKQLDSIEYTSISNLKIVLTYYICKSKSLLYVDYKEAYRIFQMANELYEVQEDKSELKLIKSQLYLLHFKFVLMPCKFGIVDHKESTLLTIHFANSTVYEIYHTSKLDSSYEMSVLLDTNEELVKLHHYWRSPREARTYSKETILLAQHLVLPIRCAYYLVYLAHADLRSSRYDDCQVKIEGLAEILCLKKYNPQADRENKPPTCADIEKDVIAITNDMQEMVLDLPVSKTYEKQYSPSSPVLVIQPFHLPAFTNHADNCDCFYCTSLEYQSLVLEKIRLDALLNIKQNNFTISTDFFHGGLKFYELCSKKYETSIETVARFISYDLIPAFNDGILESYGFTLLDYSYHLMRSENKTEALRITNQLIDLISSRKIQHIYLYNDALFQKLGYITEAPSVVPTVDRGLEMESLCPQPNIVSTTPESKHSKVTFAVQYSPNFSPPKRRVKKCLPFNLSPSQDSSSLNEPLERTSSSPVSKQPKTPAPKIKIYSSGSTAQMLKSSTTSNELLERTASSPMSKQAKTPAPKIKIYSSGSTAQTLKSSTASNKPLERTSSPPMSKQAKTPAPKIKIYSSGSAAQTLKSSTTSIQIFTGEGKRIKKKVTVNDDSCNGVSNATAKTPVSSYSVNSESELRTRTKLLTNKLRQSTKKPEVPAVLVSDDSSSQAHVPNGRRNRALRKNLFEEEKTEKEPNVPQGGAIRKSSRNRKV